MPELIGNLEMRFISTREKKRAKRREITGGIVEDKVRGFDKIGEDVGAASAKLSNKRMETTGVLS